MMVLVQHLTHTHWSAGSVGGMVLDMILYVTLYTGNSFVHLCPCQCSHFHLQPVLYFIIGGEIGGFALGLLKVCLLPSHNSSLLCKPQHEEHRLHAF